MRILLAAGLAAVVAVGTACGGSNPGSGSETLYVSAELTSDGTPDGTWVIVDVREGHSDGPFVNDATVTLRGDRTGEVDAPWQGVSFGQWQAGWWYGSNGLNWDTGWALSVKRRNGSNDGLEAYLQVPGFTEITQPIYDTTFRVSDGQPLVVKWRDNEGRRAEMVTVELGDPGSPHFRRQLNDDPLQLSIELSNVMVTDTERVTVSRRSDLNLAGGTPGSVFSAVTFHRVPFHVQ
ncbi:MAG TPA: hypothetical protein VE549_02810 [Myxococcaceae bacterium]|nr:hypothetical protein [Myxococcaceae bacterium]